MTLYLKITFLPMRFKVFLLQAVQSFSPFASSVLHDMGYQTQVVFNELVAGLHVSLGHARQIFAPSGAGERILWNRKGEVKKTGC